MLSETAIEARIWCEDVASRHEVGSIGSQNAKTDMCGNSRYVDRLCWLSDNVAVVGFVLLEDSQIVLSCYVRQLHFNSVNVPVSVIVCFILSQNNLTTRKLVLAAVVNCCNCMRKSKFASCAIKEITGWTFQLHWKWCRSEWLNKNLTFSTRNTDITVQDSFERNHLVCVLRQVITCVLHVQEAQQCHRDHAM